MSKLAFDTEDHDAAEAAARHGRAIKFVDSTGRLEFFVYRGEPPIVVRWEADPPGWRRVGGRLLKPGAALPTTVAEAAAAYDSATE